MFGRKKKGQEDDKLVVNYERLKKDGVFAIDKRVTELQERIDNIIDKRLIPLENSVIRLECPHDIKEFVECVAETSPDGSAINVSKNAHATLTGCTVNYVDRRSDKEKTDRNCWYEIRCVTCGTVLASHKYSERKKHIELKIEYLVGEADQSMKEIGALRMLAKEL